MEQTAQQFVTMEDALYRVSVGKRKKNLLSNLLDFDGKKSEFNFELLRYMQRYRSITTRKQKLYASNIFIVG
jgi:hypothetical protein